MNNSEEERLKIAVFIDFDNIAIGVKQSLNRNFDVGTVLEAIKEKGQVVTKIAYGDWKRNEDFSRAMTQHAVQMVQRNLTPGGDKNGADIALALDALEMAFTRDHINAFVIVGGDSDFIALVEKLKQYDKVVFVVGGRAFTSVILQKNCHEFISYENLIGVQSSMRRASGKHHGLSSSAPLEAALPLIRRSLKILSDREVSPQLGLLKSTLLQLDSTFSERDYGVSSFRDFTQKLADAGYVNLKQVDRSLLVELKEIPDSEPKTLPEAASEPNAKTQQGIGTSTQSLTAPGRPSEATRSLQELIRDSKAKPHWPLYLRSFKQFLKSLQPPFDEHQFGITSTYDLVRQAQKDGLLHVERNRQGILRIYPGELFPQTTLETDAEEAVQDSELEPVAKKARSKAHEPEAAKAEMFPEPVSQPEKADDAAAEPEPESPTEKASKLKPKERTKRTRPGKSRKKTAKSEGGAGTESKEPDTKKLGMDTAESATEITSGGESPSPERSISLQEVEAASPAMNIPSPGAEAEPTPKKAPAKRKRKTAAAKTAAPKVKTAKQKSAAQKSATKKSAKTTRTRKTTTRKTTTKRKSREESAPTEAT